MGTKDSGTWKLIVYPLMIIFVIGFFLNLAITPYIENGINPTQINSTNYTDPLKNFVQNGIEANITVFQFNVSSTFSFLPNLHFGGINLGSLGLINPFDAVGQVGKDFISTQIDIFNYLPEAIQLPILLILIVCFVIAIISIITWFIP